MMKLFVYLAVSLLLSPAWVEANENIETIITNPDNSAKDSRFTYPRLLLKEALERTVDRFGPYKIQQYPVPLSRQRALVKLMNGEITVFDAAARQEWETAAIPIRIPLRKGLQGYRLFLIRSEDQKKFNQVSTLDDLLHFRMGGGQQWSTTLALKRLNIDVIGGNTYEPLFKMLMQKRFDYFPRGVNEAFREKEERENVFPNLKVEENLALYMPLPTYFFVSPLKPELAKRLKIGLISMIEDGTFDRMFFAYHQNDLENANLSARKIFKVQNLNLTDETPLNKAWLWYRP